MAKRDSGIYQRRGCGRTKKMGYDVFLDGEPHSVEDLRSYDERVILSFIPVLVCAGVLERLTRSWMITPLKSYEEYKKRRLEDDIYKRCVMEVFEVRGMEPTSIENLCCEVGKRIKEEPYPGRPIPEPWNVYVNRKYRKLVDALEALKKEGCLSIKEDFVKYNLLRSVPVLKKEDVNPERDFSPETKEVLDYIEKYAEPVFMGDVIKEERVGNLKIIKSDGIRCIGPAVELSDILNLFGDEAENILIGLAQLNYIKLIELDVIEPWKSSEPRKVTYVVWRG